MRQLGVVMAWFVVPLTMMAADPLKEASRFLEQNLLADVPIVRPADFEAIREVVSSTRDPETKLHPFVFALAGRHSKLLTSGQQSKLQALITARQNAVVNWHDVRNVVRIHAQMLIWKHAAAADPDTIAQLHEQWDRWTDMRLAYMFQEFVAKETFQRAAWETLTDDQRQQMISGHWDHLIKKNVGHGRLYSADKQVRRELGAPIDQDAFDNAVQQTRQKWGPMLAAYQDAAKFQRQSEFAMDIHDAAFGLVAWPEYANAFREFAEAEFDAIRDVVQAGYATDPYS